MLEKNFSAAGTQDAPSETQEFQHFMLKEIYEQPSVVQRCLEAYLESFAISSLGEAVQPSVCPFKLNLPATFDSLQKIEIIACGTSLHASLVGKYWLEQIAKIPTAVWSASEFWDNPPPLTPNTLTIAVTQSGETADTLGALELEQKRRSVQPLPCQPLFLGITNRPGSSLERLVHHTLYTLAGVEVAIAATKTFTAQLAVFYCLALNLAYSRQVLSLTQLASMLQELRQLPAQMQKVLDLQAPVVEQLAQQLLTAQDCIVLGRGINFPIALEGALKLKETSYLHAEGALGGEFMHGPVAMLDERVPVIAISMPGQVYPKVLTNLQKVKARGARLIGITSGNPTEMTALFDELVLLPEVEEPLSPILTVIPLQLLAYYLTLQRGLDVDRPRDLSKSLTNG